MNEIRPIEDLDSSLRRLVKLSMKVRKRAYAPYSKFYVGCALLDNRGKIFTGCNVENASYSGCICAERVALSKMVSKGGKECKKIVIVTPSEEPIFPCGICLQFLGELGRKSLVVAVNCRGSVFRQAMMTELLPAFFSSDLLI